MKIAVDYPGLCEERTPAGTPRWRVRVAGQKKRRMTLPTGVSPDHPQFQDHYDAARRGQKFEAKPIEPIRKGTLDELCKRYLAWLADQVAAGSYSQLTLSGRRTGLDHARNCPAPKGGKRMGELHADLPLAAFAHIRDSFGSRTGAAQTCLKALRAAYTWGKEQGYKGGEAVFDVRNTHRQKGGATPWTADDEQKFLDAHGPGTMARCWFLLAKNIAGRIGDMHRLGPVNEVTRASGDAVLMFIKWQPGKKGSVEVQIPMSWELSMELAGLAADAPSYLLTDYGRPFASSGWLDNRVRKWIVEAGLVSEDGKANRSQHGVRKRRAEEIAEVGGSVYEVMAHLSHSDPKTSAIYTQRVERARLAEQAIRRMEQSSKTRGVPRSQNRGTPAAISADKTTI